ncbi:MAG: hypothetical protein V1724_08815 [Chloroflexota bacterium]
MYHNATPGSAWTTPGVSLAREVYQATPNFKQKDCAKLLGMSAASVSQWVQDILATRREERMHKAWKLQLLGWAQEEIADGLGVKAQSTIHEDLSKSSERRWRGGSTSRRCSSGSPMTTRRWSPGGL